MIFAVWLSSALQWNNQANFTVRLKALNVFWILSDICGESTENTFLENSAIPIQRKLSIWKNKSSLAWRVIFEVMILTIAYDNLRSRSTEHLFDACRIRGHVIDRPSGLFVKLTKVPTKLFFHISWQIFSFSSSSNSKEDVNLAQSTPLLNTSCSFPRYVWRVTRNSEYLEVYWGRSNEWIVCCDMGRDPVPRQKWPVIAGSENKTIHDVT